MTLTVIKNSWAMETTDKNKINKYHSLVWEKGICTAYSPTHKGWMSRGSVCQDFYQFCNSKEVKNGLQGWLSNKSMLSWDGPKCLRIPDDIHKYSHRQSYWDIEVTKTKREPLAFQSSFLPGDRGWIWQIPLFNTFIDPIAPVFVKFSNNVQWLQSSRRKTDGKGRT